MEPGDLRINSRLRDESGVPKHSPGSSYGPAGEANAAAAAALHYRNQHVRPAVITDGRHHHVPSPMPGNPLVLDRSEPVKIWRDPNLMNSGEIRHVVSMQHSGVVHMAHPMVAHSTVNTGGSVYHHDKPLDPASRGHHMSTADVLRGRAPVYAPPHHPHPPPPPSHHSPNTKPPMDAWRPGPGVVQNSKDFRLNLNSKSTVEQAVHDHFVESLRLAHLKGTQPTVVKHEERPNPHLVAPVPLQRFYPPPSDKRHHDMSPSPVVYHQIHSHQQKGELPAPPPLRSEQPYRTIHGPDSRKHQVYGAPDIMSRPSSHEALQQHNSIRTYEQEPISRHEVLPSDNCVRYQKLPPAPSPRRHTNDPHQQQQSHLIERNQSPFAKQVTPVVSPNSYHMYQQHQHQQQQAQAQAQAQAHMNKHKVNSPVSSSQMYGKPGGHPHPGARMYETGNESSIPMPLTSKGGVIGRPSQSSPTAYAAHTHSHSTPSLPQHDMRKSDVAYYMYNNGPPGFHHQPSVSPQQAHIHTIQTQPLDLGGKRKIMEEDVANNMYKGAIPDYANDQATINKLNYGSRKPPVHSMDDARHKQFHNPNLTHPAAPLTEVLSKRKMEDATMPLHLDTKKVRSDTSVISSSVNLTGGSRVIREPESPLHHQLPTSYMKPNRTHPGLETHLPPHTVSVIASVGSGADAVITRVKPEYNRYSASPVLPSDIIVRKPASTNSGNNNNNIGANMDTHSHTSVITTVTTVGPTSLVCNGRLRESTPESGSKSVIVKEPKATTDPGTDSQPSKMVVKNETKSENSSSTSGITASATSSPSTTPGPSTSLSAGSTPAVASTPSKFQKVLPKKAWVLQWHEVDEIQNQNTDTNSAATNSDPGNSSNPVNTSESTQKVAEKRSEEDDMGTGGDKVANGGGAATAELVVSEEKAEENKIPGTTESVATTTANSQSQSVNGFGKERLNDNSSDIGSENESDSSNKGKSLTENSSNCSSPTKKNSEGNGVSKNGKEAKVKDGASNGQSSPKPDLRKDGLCKRPPVSQLKKTGDSFIQAETCNRVTPKVAKCRECRWHPPGRGSKKQSGAYCRFYGFRKLRYTKGGSLTIAGFSDPYTDPAKITEHDQFRLWLPPPKPPEELDLSMSKFLMTELSHQFCDLVRQEEEARSMLITQEQSIIAWKPLLKGVREMCDVCDTTLFNFHWTCGKCGFVVCLACFKLRKNEAETEKECEQAGAGKDRDEFQWLFCSNRSPHESDKLMLVQTIAGDALTDLNNNLHSMCTAWDIELNCDCSSRCSQTQPKTDRETTNHEKEEEEMKASSELNETNSTTEVPKSDSMEVKGSKEGEETLEDKEVEEYFKRSLTEKILRIQTTRLKNSYSSTNELPPVVNSTVKHSWLCNGKILRLLEPTNPENFTLFHEIWKRGQPVLVSSVADKLNKDLWTAESFSDDFGDYKNDFVNCITGEVLINQQIKKFWEGFTVVGKRQKDENGEPMLLKLKDWPPTDDFSQTLPSRYQDLMGALPLPEYTLRDGKRNLAARLPPEFMKPDLGPKMYVGYGSGLYMDKGTTNLHLDVSDVVNVLAFCGPPGDVDKVEHNKGVMTAIEESGCDAVTMDRVKQDKEVPGALWHIYDAGDANKIRNFLNKVAIENGDKIDKDHDAIHKQNCYLDKTLRKRLETEYNVSGYTILQCAGDAIMIPAGAPHQVRNLQNCIKVAEEFVSPENISHSFYLSEEESYNLCKAQSNREDKLQIKNIVYHTVKDAVSVLLHAHNTEKSENSSKNTIDSSTTTALPKDCQKSTSPG